MVRAGILYVHGFLLGGTSPGNDVSSFVYAAGFDLLILVKEFCTHVYEEY